MSEYGEIETGEAHGGLAEAHQETGSEQDYNSQYGILDVSHESIEHEEFEHVKHIEYTDAQGNHYEETEYVHYEHTEVEQDHTFASYGSEGGNNFVEAADEDNQMAFAQADTSISQVDSLTERFEDFLGDVLGNGKYEISDSSA